MVIVSSYFFKGKLWRPGNTGGCDRKEEKWVQNDKLSIMRLRLFQQQQENSCWCWNNHNELWRERTNWWEFAKNFCWSSASANSKLTFVKYVNCTGNDALSISVSISKKHWNPLLCKSRTKFFILYFMIRRTHCTGGKVSRATARPQRIKDTHTPCDDASVFWLCVCIRQREADACCFHSNILLFR